MLANQQVISQSFNDLKPLDLPFDDEKVKNLAENPGFSLAKCDVFNKDIQAAVEYIRRINPDILAPNRQELKFIESFVSGATPTQAALYAGFADTTARLASAWLRSNSNSNKKINVFLAIYDKLLIVDTLAIEKAATLLAKRKIDAHYIETELVVQYEKANGDIPYHYKITIDKHTGEEKKIAVYKPSQQAALKSLELLGKHKAIKAFDNTIEHTSSDLSNLLSTIRTSFRPPKLTVNKTAKKEQPYIEGESVIIPNDTPYYPPEVPDLPPIKPKRGRPKTSSAPYRDEKKGAKRGPKPKKR